VPPAKDATWHFKTSVLVGVGDGVTDGSGVCVETTGSGFETTGSDVGAKTGVGVDLIPIGLWVITFEIFPVSSDGILAITYDLVSPIRLLLPPLHLIVPILNPPIGIFCAVALKVGPVQTI
jgi:hypothetical protein